MTSAWDWKPNISLGEILLGDDAGAYIVKLGLTLEPDDNDSTEWLRYKHPDSDVYIDVEDNKVVSIASYGEFIYQGVNIIGLKITELELMLGKKADEMGNPVTYDDGDTQVPYDFFEFGLQVWISGNKIVSASCVNYNE